MKVAIVGSGISGLVAAHRLHPRHEVTIFEAEERVGGHAMTVDVATPRGPVALDVGFLVYTEGAYPLFTALLRELGVEGQRADMSLSVRCDRTGLEYGSSSLGALFAQPSNLVRPSFLRLLSDVLRFNRAARRQLSRDMERKDDSGPTLGEHLRDGGFSRTFVEQHVVPLACALWSSPEDVVLDFPARFFVRFMERHDFLRVRGRQEWLTVRGASRRYVDTLTSPLRGRIRTSSPVSSIRRLADGVEITFRTGQVERFNRVVVAVHSDDALALLADASEDEQAILGAIPYQRNDALLHSDPAVMPRRRRAWSSWNYYVRAHSDAATVTYWLNRLQSLDADRDFFVTLNGTEAVNPGLVHRTLTFRHPAFTPRGVAAQARRSRISGARRTHYCGAYWGFGFHEDGVASATAACAEIDAAASGEAARRETDDAA